VEVEYARIRDRKTGKVLSWEEANRDETLWSRALEYKVPEAPITNIIVNKAVRETPPVFLPPSAFPYVCPEPVLAKSSFFTHELLKKGRFFGRWTRCGTAVRKTPLFAMPFIYKNDHFTKTGSGQT